MSRFGLHAGWLAGAVFIAALLALGAVTPGYEHAHEAVSELGAIGAPCASWWNALGFGLPGVLIACFAAALFAPLQREGVGASARIGVWLLLISGLAFAGNGVFAYDLQQPYAQTSKLHVAMLTITLLAFVPATLLLALSLRGRGGWRALVGVGPLIALVALLSVIQRMWDFVPLLQGNPGYAQRVTLAMYFMWLALAAFTALRLAATPASMHRRR